MQERGRSEELSTDDDYHPDTSTNSITLISKGVSGRIATGLFPRGNFERATNQKSQPSLVEAGRLFRERALAALATNGVYLG